jgi:shikimate kinase
MVTIMPGSVVSLTGSNPMDMSVMEALKGLKTGIFIYLDVHLDDIVKRLGDMKVSRIVGHSDACCGTLDHQDGVSTPIRQIVDRRAMYYDPWFDLRVWPKVHSVSCVIIRHRTYPFFEDIISYPLSRPEK